MSEMVQMTLKVDGMACGMCEAHINDAIRSHFAVKKVSSSHTKGETVIRCEEPLGEERLRAVIAETGYELKSAHSSRQSAAVILVMMSRFSCWWE